MGFDLYGLKPNNPNNLVKPTLPPELIKSKMKEYYNITISVES